MRKIEFEKTYNVNLKSKADSWWMRLVGKVWPAFQTNFFTTLRFFGFKASIYYPSQYDKLNDDDEIPYWWNSTLEHELVHVEQMTGTWGLIKSGLLYSLFPLPVLFSGRWLIERDAYLLNIVKHGYNIDMVVNMLWGSYFFPWPKSLMKKWFLKEVERSKDVKGQGSV